MSLITLSIANLLNGVSQQSPALRFPTQAEAQENLYASPVEGLGKRPPTEHVQKLINGDAGKATVHAIDRGDGTERYIAVIRSGGIGVYRINDDGTTTTMTVTIHSNVHLTAGVPTYLTTTKADSVFKAVSVADYTFILNTDTVVSMDSGTATVAAVNEALVWIKQGAYSTKYSIAGTVAADIKTGPNTHSAVTHDGESLNGISTADVVGIMAELKDVFVTNGGTSGNGWTVTRGLGSYTTYFSKTAAFNMTVNSGLGDSGIGLVKDSVQSFSDLPAVAKNNMIVRVDGLPDSTEDDYYVKFASKDTTSTLSEGLWSETVGPSTVQHYNYNTMPHALIRVSATEFVFKRLDGTQYSSFTNTANKWTGRAAGDASSNPNPSFIGKTINDIFLFRGRLGFLCQEAIVLSEAGNYFNFFRSTVTTLLDSDPIDVGSSYPAITVFRHAVPFAERLVVFSDQTQFVLSGTPALTPKTATLNVVGNYDTLSYCRPVVVAESVFFGFDRGGYSGVREMITSPNDNATLTAPDISSHVPKYINGKLRQIVGSTHDNILIGVTDQEPFNLYVYKWLNSGNERVQSSWSRWSFNGGEIRGIAWMKSTLYMAIQRKEGLYLEKITVEPNRRDENSAFVTCLDRRFKPTVKVYDSSTNLTTITIPYTVGNYSRMRVVAQATETMEAGYSYTVYIPGSLNLLDNEVDSGNSGPNGGEGTGEDNSTYDPGSEFPDEDGSGSGSGGGGGGGGGGGPTPPDRPTNLVASDGDTSHSDYVQLNWDASANAISYAVWREVNGVKERLGNGDLITVTSFQDSSALAGVVYTYYVQAFNSVGTSPFSLPDNGNRPAGSIGGTVANTIVVKGNVSAIEVWVGEVYSSRYEFSTQYVKQQSNTGTSVYASGRYQMRNMYLVYSDSSYFRARVVNRFGSAVYLYEYTGKILGTGLSVIAAVPINSGTFKFPVHGKNDEMRIDIINDNHLPFHILSAEIEASYVTRSQRA